jgi:SAM-dependent methyltransferase
MNPKPTIESEQKPANGPTCGPGRLGSCPLQNVLSACSPMTPEEAFFSLYEGLPRQGPGSESSTHEALKRLGTLKRPLRVIDLGCGSGASTLLLARELQSHIVALDQHAPFLEALAANADQEGLKSLIHVRQGDITQLEEPEYSYDLIWAEGVAYLIGFERALTLWRPLLAPGGRVALSELTWLANAPSDEPRAFWKKAYPGMTSRDGNCHSAERVGFSVLDTFTLPSDDWWNEYYRPLRRRIAAFRASHTVPRTIEAILSETEREMDIVERYSEEFGYVFYLLELDENALLADEDEEPVSTQRSSIREPALMTDGSVRSGGASSRRSRANSVASRPVSRRSLIEALNVPVDWQARVELERKFTQLVAELGLSRAQELLASIRARVEASIDK